MTPWLRHYSEFLDENLNGYLATFVQDQVMLGGLWKMPFLKFPSK